MKHSEHIRLLATLTFTSVLVIDVDFDKNNDQTVPEPCLLYANINCYQGCFLLHRLDRIIKSNEIHCNIRKG